MVMSKGQTDNRDWRPKLLEKAKLDWEIRCQYDSSFLGFFRGNQPLPVKIDREVL